jgi:hypothetical protein
MAQQKEDSGGSVTNNQSFTGARGGMLPTKLTEMVLGVGVAALLLLCGGCETAEMKGTPFYSGDFGKRTGTAENRVNGWPLVYYRDPALSVLWPLYESTDDHRAVRPLFSIYGLDGDKHQYNVLWPLAQFDRRTDENWIFPAFWGDGYGVVFPLYWHSGHPLGEKGGSDSLFPLWVFGRHGEGDFSLYCPWPLTHWWNDANRRESGSYVLPLYCHSQEKDSDSFVSPLWMNTTHDDGAYNRALLPLAFWWSSANHRETGSSVLPLYWHDRESDRSRFYSLLWLDETSQDGDYWRSALPPFCFWWSDAHTHESGAEFLPLFWHDKNNDRSVFYSLLWWDETQSNGDYNRALLPLAFWWSDNYAHESGSTVLPLYWHSRDSQSARFYSLLWMSGSQTNGDHWRSLLPLFYQSADQTSSLTVTPLWAGGRSAGKNWQSIIPLAYWDREQHTLISALWAHWQDENESVSLAPMALSWLTSNKDHSDLWLLGGLGRASWGPKPVPQYVVPLFYHDSAKHSLITPLWGQWNNHGEQGCVLPAALTWWNGNARHDDLYLLGGLAHASWGQEPGSQHVVPLFYRDAANQEFLTLLCGWKSGDDGFFYPFTPIAGVAHSGDRKSSWFIPLFWHSQNEKTGDKDNNFFLLGGNRQQGRHRDAWCWPLFHYSNHGPLETVPEKTETYATYGTSCWVLPLNWFINECRVAPASPAAPGYGESTRQYLRKQFMFPLWAYSASSIPAQNKSEVFSFVPLLLYDYKREIGPVAGGQSGGTND